ncbi:MAG: uncharacterized protein K0S12_1445 [Bacteroidetes bacterium]|nr:uncharacterized protein [Bacteroidota bacterium]
MNDYFLTASGPLNADINYFIQSPDDMNGLLAPFYTLLVNLEEPQETIWNNIYHRTRSEINSFLSNQDYDYQLKFSIPPSELQEYIDLYNAFAKSRRIRKAESSRLKAYNANGLLAVSYLKQNNSFLCINFYRVNTQRACNLYSFHLKHNKDNTHNSSHLGRAHRTLHWLDMLEFKKLKVNYYDFCGWYSGSENKELLNVNKFKEQFSGNKVKEYSGVIYKSLFLRLIRKLRNG